MEGAIAMFLCFGGIPFLWMVGSGIEQYLSNKNKPTKEVSGLEEGK